MIEFICIDCQREVVDIIAEEVPEPPLCMICRYVRGEPEGDREKLRKFLIDRE